MDAETLKKALDKLEKHLTKTKSQGYLKFPIEEITLINGEDGADAIEIDFTSERLKSLVIEPDGRAVIEIMQEVEL